MRHDQITGEQSAAQIIERRLIHRAPDIISFPWERGPHLRIPPPSPTIAETLRHSRRTIRRRAAANGLHSSVSKHSIIEEIPNMNRMTRRNFLQAAAIAAAAPA